jgi:multidrug efflux pump subunit AcrA (membrane-fusion protein)
MQRTLNARWKTLTVAAIGIALCLAATGCERTATSSDVQPVAVAAKEVAVAHARLEPWPETIRIQGSLLAFEDATIGSKLAGRVQTVAVDVGSIVREGDPW